MIIITFTIQELGVDKPDFGKIARTPGIYIFKDGQERVLYVGKAKELRKRLASYFRDGACLPMKTRAMLTKAEQLETISTGTENEALLLEASLIKKHRPHYNIKLRDDKDYALFRLDTAKPYPRLEVVRQGNIRKGGKRGRSRAGDASVSNGSDQKGGLRLFGPYTSGRDARLTWKAIHKIFPLRRCSDKAMKNRSRSCLYHHLGQCPAPCVLEVSREEYAATVNKVILLLQGRSRELLRNLEAEMREAAANLRFERAAALRDQLRAVENTVEKQAVLLGREQDLDVIGLAESRDGLALGLLFVRGGSLLGSRNFFWPKLELADAGELLLSFLLQYYTGLENMPPRVLLPWNPDEGLPEASGVGDGADCPPGESPATEPNELAALESFLSDLHGQSLRLNTPRNESEEKLVRMASTNANEYARQRGEQDLPGQLAKALGSPRPIERIEAVDVSHTSGSATRAAMVVFEGGRPLRSDWRNYAFDDLSGGGDDYAVLAAWAERRAASGPPWPDLLLIDGGRGQVGAVYRKFAELGLEGEFCLAGIAKARDDEGRSDRRAGNIEDRIFVPGRSNPLGFKPGSPELLFLQHVRNHVHDFVLGRHRKARNSQALKGELARIPGFGPGLARALWDKFDSLQAMAEADDAALRSVPGLGAARIKALREHLSLVLK